MLRFNDGVTIRTEGPLRVTRKNDGYYVVGRGMSIPVSDRDEGSDLIKKLNKEEEEK